MVINKQFLFHCLFFMIGLFLISLGVNITIASNFGVGGWDAANIGLVSKFGLTIGFWLNVWAVCYLLLSAVIEKKRPKIECFITSIILGICIDSWMLLFQNIHIDEILYQFPLFLLGVSTTSLGAGLYIVSELPVNPIDHLMMVLTRCFKLSISHAKYMVEGTGMLLGFLLGGPVGFGTILMILIFGPLIQFFTARSKVLLVNLTK